MGELGIAVPCSDPPPPLTHHSSQCLLGRLVVVVPGMFGQKAVFCNYTELLFCALCIGEENRQVSAGKIALTALLADIVASACSSPTCPQPCCRFRWRSLNATAILADSLANHPSAGQATKAVSLGPCLRHLNCAVYLVHITLLVQRYTPLYSSCQSRASWYKESPKACCIVTTRRPLCLCGQCVEFGCGVH